MGSKNQNQFPIDGIANNDLPWDLAELLFKNYKMLAERVERLEQELNSLRTIPTYQNPTPIISRHTRSKPQTAEFGCQTRDEAAMEIEVESGQQRRPIRRSFYHKSTFFMKVYVKKRAKRENMEVEVSKREHTTKHPKKIPEKRNRLVKVYVAKEVMQIETTKVEPGEKTRTPSEKARKGRAKGKRKKETPKEWAPQRKSQQKNTPKRDLDGAELNLDKNLTQPAKFSLITDFFHTLNKLKSVPDPE